MHESILSRMAAIDVEVKIKTIIEIAKNNFYLLDYITFLHEAT